MAEVSEDDEWNLCHTVLPKLESYGSIHLTNVLMR